MQYYRRKSKASKKRTAQLKEVKHANKKLASLVKKLTTKSIGQRQKITTITEKLEGLKLELKTRIKNLQFGNKLSTRQNKILKRKLDRINRESMT